MCRGRLGAAALRRWGGFVVRVYKEGRMSREDSRTRDRGGEGGTVGVDGGMGRPAYRRM